MGTAWVVLTSHGELHLLPHFALFAGLVILAWVRGLFGLIKVHLEIDYSGGYLKVKLLDELSMSLLQFLAPSFLICNLDFNLIA